MQINCISCTCETVAPCSFIGYEFISIQGIRIIIIFRLLVMVHVYTKAKAISYPIRTEFISNPFFCVCETTDSIAKKREREEKNAQECRACQNGREKRHWSHPPSRNRRRHDDDMRSMRIAQDLMMMTPVAAQSKDFNRRMA